MLTKVGHGILKNTDSSCVTMCLKKENHNVKIMLEEDFIKQPFLKLYAKLKGNTHGINKHMLAKVGHGILKHRLLCCVSMRLKKEKKVKIMLEEDFIKQPFLKRYAKLKGNTNGIKKPHADESRTRDFERDLFRACPCALKKKT